MMNWHRLYSVPCRKRSFYHAVAPPSRRYSAANREFLAGVEVRFVRLPVIIRVPESGDLSMC